VEVIRSDPASRARNLFVPFHSIDGHPPRAHLSFVLANRSANVKACSSNRIKLARCIAIGADLLQIGLFPFFFEGFASPLDDALDVIVCALLTFLVGWHYSFLPCFVVKVTPVADLVPCWTLAVFLATSRKRPVSAPGNTVVYDHGPTRPD
jgi:hypothetical protein